MKALAVIAVIAGGAFLLMAVQMGLIGGPRVRPAKEDESTEKPTETVKRAAFPEDLAPAAQARAVPQAAAFKPANAPHKIVVMRPTGVLHPWHDHLDEDWQADTVASTELVLVVGGQKKTFVDRNHFNVGPPIDRFNFECEVSVVEAKTGTVLANRLFKNVPRRIMHREAFESNAIGRVITWQQVFPWVARHAKIGFPDENDPTPMVTEVQ